jgi:hypothetical protein
MAGGFFMHRVMHSSMGVACGLALLVVGCSEPTGSHDTRTLQPHLEALAILPTLLVCPTNDTHSATETIGPSGGTIATSGARLTLPAGAVSQPTTFTLTVPASKYLEIGVEANGAEHFQFERPVTVEVKYSRCAPGSTDSAELSVWYIDPITKLLLENMGATDDKGTRTVTFETGHLSGYAIAQ